jgi:hypothetical protein
MDLGVLLSFSQSFRSPKPSGWTFPPPPSAARFTRASRVRFFSRVAPRLRLRGCRNSPLLPSGSRPSAARALSTQRTVALAIWERRGLS